MTPFAWPARVYWEDTDGGGIVYYANYLRFLERARTEWLRARGYDQSLLARETGLLFSVVNVNIHYRKPAKLDDQLTVTCTPGKEGRATARFTQHILRGEELLVEADVRVACLDAQTLKPRRLPAFVLEEMP